MKTLFTALLFLSFVSDTYAVVTDHPLPNNGSAPQACYIKFINTSLNSSDPFKAQAACTGTLIRNNRLLTAAHCMDNVIKNGDEPQVICNNGKQSYEAIGYEIHPAYDQIVDDKGFTDYDIHDVAIFDLKVPKKNAIAPVAIVSDFSDLTNLLSHPEKCALYGYGRPDDGEGNNWGYLVIGPMDYLTQAQANQAGETPDPQEDIYIGPSTHAAPGDSGGPILCTRDDGTVVQIATTMERSHIPVQNNPSQMEYLSRHEVTSFNADWINSTADKPKLANDL